MCTIITLNTMTQCASYSSTPLPWNVLKCEIVFRGRTPDPAGSTLCHCVFACSVAFSTALFLYWRQALCFGRNNKINISKINISIVIITINKLISCNNGACNKIIEYVRNKVIISYTCIEYTCIGTFLLNNRYSVIRKATNSSMIGLA